ncbi:MAG: holo-ACP synthase [Clostridiales bacterium]|nr:holo-ACP synthase [Clostridiales bacterium]
MHIRGTGVDIVECARFERLITKQSFMNRVFSERELQYISGKGKLKYQSAAGIFCAKEAFLKACNTGILSLPLKEIEVDHDENGKPYIHLLNFCKEKYFGLKFELSISHCASYAVATVIAVKDD